MDTQKMFDALSAQQRQDDLSSSPQLLLGELILKLESVIDKDKELHTDFGTRPTNVSSWRGSYRELAIEFDEDMGGGVSIYNSDQVEWKSPDGELKSYKAIELELPKNPTVQDFIDHLLEIQDKEFVGYKGGDFKMHKGVAVYFANAGDSSVDGYKGEEYATVALVDIEECADIVKIITINTEK